MDVRDLSDAQLEAIAAGDQAAFTRATAEAHGVRPDLALSLRQAESGGDQGAVSPKGARGQMQLMPGTARDLGVNPDDPYENIVGGVRYLRQQLDDFGGDERLALAAYNAGPNAVREHGGVPPYRETRHYVDTVMAGRGGAPDLSGYSDAQLEAIAGGGGPDTADRAAEPPPAAPPPKAPQKPVQIPGRVPGVPSLFDDVVSGGAEPFVRLWQRATSGYEAAQDRLRNPPGVPSLGDFVGGTVSGLSDSLGLVGDVLNLGSAPFLAVARPAGRVAAEHLPTPTKAPEFSVEGGVPHFTAPRKMDDAEARDFFEGSVMDALGAAAPTKRVSLPARAKIPTLEELKDASDAAWSAVDASGFRFPQVDVKAAASDIANIVKTAGAELYPEASKIAARVESLAKNGGLTPAQANRLRSQVGEKLLHPGSTEGSVGAAIKARIDALIDTANDPNLAVARDLYTRLKKLTEVTERTESAELAREGAGTGGNQNAVRQKFKPLIDPKSPQRMRNATKDEKAAIRKVVKGTPTQNAARLMTAFDPTAGKLQALLSTGMAGATLGKTLALMPLGVAAKVTEAAMAAKNLEDLRKVIAAGGSKAALKGVPLSAFGVPVLGGLEVSRIPELLRDAVSPRIPQRAPAAPAQSGRR